MEVNSLYFLQVYTPRNTGYSSEIERNMKGLKINFFFSFHWLPLALLD